MKSVFTKYKILFLIFFVVGYCKIIKSQSYDTTKFKTDEIKVFSNKIVTDNFNSPTKIQFIDRKKIEDKNGETLSDILQLAGGVFIKSYGGNSSLSTISLNGLGAEHTLVLLNGFKLNSTQNNQLDLVTISKDNIERVEVLNNGSSAIYGSEAIGGVVNIITKNFIKNDFNIKLNGQVGSYNQRKIFLSFGKKIKSFNFDLDFSKESSLNNYDYYFHNGVEEILKERANSNYDILNYSLSFNYIKDNNSKLSYFINYIDQFRNLSGIETGSAPSKSKQLDKNWNNVLTYENILSKNVLLKSQSNFQNNLSNYSDKTIINSFYKNIYLSNSSQINYLKKNFELISGYEISYATLKSNEVEDNIGRIQASLFVVSEINLNKMLKIFPSLRYDFISDINKNVVSGKLGLNVKPFSHYKLNFKATAGNNFASPTFNELYWKKLGNKNLKPESSVNFDAGTIFDFNLFSDNTIEVTYTYIEAKDKIVWSPNTNGLWIPKNIGKSTSNALLLDVNLNKEFLKNFKASLNLKYSYTQSLKKSKDFSDDPSFNKQIFYIPSELAKYNLSLKYKNSGLNVFYSFLGKRYTDFENINFLPAVDLFEGNIYQNFRINRLNVQLKLEVNNIFNADYQIISGYPMPLRNYKINLSLEY